ncbi:MAG: 2-dehydro-3-deoxygalactonokinase [Rhizobiaceae bacterium]
MKPVRWIGVDWGTTNLRAFAMDANGHLIEEKSSDRGMAKLQPHAFESALLDLIAPWLSRDTEIPVYACGMVGAKQGWREARYCKVPCPPVAADGLTYAPTQDKRIRVHILPGLSQSAPADVLRGEETQISGLLAHIPDYSGAVCLPGTHSKWVSVADGKVERFTTYLTGELFDILSGHTILRHSVGGDEWDNQAFLSAARRAVREPQCVAEELFGLRADSLLNGEAPRKLRARLSGMLIGQEIGLSKRYWSSQNVTLIGSSATVPFYQQVLQDQGCKVEIIDAKDASLAGLALVASILFGSVCRA